MTRVEYELLASERPDLKLPTWTLMWEEAQLFVEKHTRDQIIAIGCGRILSGQDFILKATPSYRATHFD